MRPALGDAHDVAGMGAARFLFAEADLDRDACSRSRAWPLPATSGLGSSSADTTRAMPAVMMASAQGGVLP